MFQVKPKVLLLNGINLLGICVKETNLDFATIYPTNFDKEKVQLTTNVFNEKTTAGLKKGDNEHTAIFGLFFVC